MVWTPAFGHRKLVKHTDDGEPHFLTFSCYHRLPLFSKDRTRQWFVEALNEARREHGFHLWSWVLMPEHVHLLVWPPAEMIRARGTATKGTIRGILADLKRPVGRKAIRHLKANAPAFLERLTVRHRDRTYRRFWQAGSGHDENVSASVALHEIEVYIHQNPVRRGLVARAEDWPWSSAREWSDPQAHSPCPIDRTLPTAHEIDA